MKIVFRWRKQKLEKEKKKAEIGNVAAADFHFYFVSCRCVRLRV